MKLKSFIPILLAVNLDLLYLFIKVHGMDTGLKTFIGVGIVEFLVTICALSKGDVKISNWIITIPDSDSEKPPSLE